MAQPKGGSRDSRPKRVGSSPKFKLGPKGKGGSMSGGKSSGKSGGGSFGGGGKGKKR